jgi:hypothetical protein
MDESVEEDVVEEIKEHFVETPKEKEENEINKQVNDIIVKQEAGRLSFNDIDSVKDSNDVVASVAASKDPDVLDQISAIRNEQRKLDSNDDDESEERLKISDQNIDLGPIDIHVIDPPSVDLLPDLLLDDIEVLT